jgi:hypothetical protein
MLTISLYTNVCLKILIDNLANKTQLQSAIPGPGVSHGSPRAQWTRYSNGTGGAGMNVKSLLI